MKNRHADTTMTIPAWIDEVSSRPKQYVSGLLQTLAFLKMKEYERQAQVFQKKYNIPFRAFEKKVIAQKKERTDWWDDYLVWKGIEEARQKWAKRYRAT